MTSTHSPPHPHAALRVGITGHRLNRLLEPDVDLASLHAQVRAVLAEIQRAATEWGMRVLKIMPAIYNVRLSSPLASSLMSTARELNLVVNIHSGSEISHPLAIGALCRRFPDVPVLMDHMGYREWTGDAIEVARDNPNVYLGTTIAAVEPVTVERAVRELALTAAGADRGRDAQAMRRRA